MNKKNFGQEDFLIAQNLEGEGNCPPATRMPWRHKADMQHFIMNRIECVQ